MFIYVVSKLTNMYNSSAQGYQNIFIGGGELSHGRLKTYCKVPLKLRPIVKAATSSNYRIGPYDRLATVSSTRHSLTSPSTGRQGTKSHTFGTWGGKLDFDEPVPEVVSPLGRPPSSLQFHQPTRRQRQLKINVMLPDRRDTEHAVAFRIFFK